MAVFSPTAAAAGDGNFVQQFHSGCGYLRYLHPGHAVPVRNAAKKKKNKTTAWPFCSAPASGNSSSDRANARWAATASMPVHQWMLDRHAAGLRRASASRARAAASWRKKVTVSVSILPPTSRPTTTNLRAFAAQRRKPPPRASNLSSDALRRPARPDFRESCQRQLARLGTRGGRWPARQCGVHPPAGSPDFSGQNA